MAKHSYKLAPMQYFTSKSDAYTHFYKFKCTHCGKISIFFKSRIRKALLGTDDGNWAKMAQARVGTGESMCEGKR